MNSLAVMLFSLSLLGAGYIFYARVFERFLDINPDNVTPAYKYFDGVDYVPAKNWLVLFSHHFASIAGAGPIVGPVIAAAIWGFWPAVLWIVIGTIFMGGIHDLSALVISIRHKARSIPDIAEDVISRRSKLIFLSFVWLSLILVIAVFASICAKTLVTDTKTIIPSFGLIIVAFFVGQLLYRFKMNIVVTTIIGLFLLIVCIVAGDIIPINSKIVSSYNLWVIVLLIYAFAASVTPVHIILQPRDYISSFLLYFGIIAGFAGIIVSRPEIGIDSFRGWNPEGSEWLWPMLFVMIACGANSGFHALVASGTTSKQISSERYAKRIGYGSMVLEAVLSILALLAVSAAFDSEGLKLVLSKGGSGPIGAFGRGYGVLTSDILFSKGHIVAVLILNAFILTTLDTATRITRYLSEELFKIKNRFFSTFVVIFIGGILALSGKWSKIWPVFGASNQLVAALTFIVISSWFLCKGKSLKFTFLPIIFMLFTSMGALVYQIFGFFKEGNFGLVIIALILIVLSIIMVADVFISIRRKGLKCEIV